MTITVTESADRELAHLMDLFGPLADEADPRPLCWVYNGDDGGEDYCLDCCEALCDTHNWAMAVDEDHEWEVDGGGDLERQADGPTFCKICGHLLGYVLSDMGLADELAEFPRFVDGTPVDAALAYGLYALFEAALYAAPELKDEAITLGRAAEPFLAPVA